MNQPLPFQARTGCPACSGEAGSLGYAISNVPANSVRIHRSESAASSIPTGDIDLAGCLSCGFIWNTAFDPELVEYSSDYEATQAYSETYRRFLRAQADELVEAYGLRNKRIVEIGCGHGEFLAEICEAGENFGIGFDPAFSADRAPSIKRGSFEVRAEPFDANTKLPEADFICCRNTLEHLADVGEFVSGLRAVIGESGEPLVFFQVPAWERIAAEGAFWDIYYEHCSYFTAASLTALFERNGFDVLSCERSYGEQYLSLLARPARDSGRPPLACGSGFGDLIEAGHRLQQEVKEWTTLLCDHSTGSGPTILWGGGSKAVALLTTCDIADGVHGVVDINPYKQDAYLPGSGVRVMAPEALKSVKPERVVVMNPIYVKEIRARLAQLDVTTQVIGLGVE